MLDIFLAAFAAVCLLATAAVTAVLIRRRRTERAAHRRAELAAELDFDAATESVDNLLAANPRRRLDAAAADELWPQLPERRWRDLPTPRREALDRYDLPQPRPAFDDTTGYYSGYVGGTTDSTSTDPTPSTHAPSPGSSSHDVGASFSGGSFSGGGE